MKTYTLKTDTITINGTDYIIVLPDNIAQQMGISNTLVTYPAPYERNDRLILLRDEMDPTDIDKELEPESGRLLYADLDFEYNYYSRDFENFQPNILGGNTAYTTHRINYFPSLNVWLLNNRTDENEDGVPDYIVDQAYASSYDNMFKSWDVAMQDVFLNDSLSKQYFEGWGRYVHAVLDGLNGLQAQDQYFGQILQYKDHHGSELPPEFINLDSARVYADTHNTRENFPFYVKFYMTGVRKSEFCGLLEEHGLESAFIDFLAAKRDSSNRAESVEHINSIDSTANKVEDVYGYNIRDFLDHIASGNYNNTQSSTGSPVEDCEYFENFIQQQIFIQKVENFFERCPDNHIFPVAFRLEKVLLHETIPNGKIVAVKYFFNYDDLLEFRYYDSQIYYRGNFIYRIRVINGIVKPWHLFQQFPATAKTCIFLESAYYEETLLILDSPPIAPDVELLTYRGIDNKVLILLNQMIDQKVAVPIIINDSDWVHTFEDQYAAQGIAETIGDKRNPILFESDDPVDFEIFRTTKHPVSYDDFRNEYYKFVSSGDPRKMTAASYLDAIKPNQPYYYIFRAQDVHGHVSNPSPIYEFILNKEGETLYPKIRIVDFADPEPPLQKTKTFKKYLKIGFSPRQYQIPSDELQNINDTLVNGDVKIGIADTDNIIGSDRVFKFRIRSKNTGKLIDINVTFKKNEVIKA